MGGIALAASHAYTHTVLRNFQKLIKAPFLKRQVILKYTSWLKRIGQATPSISEQSFLQVNIQLSILNK